MENTPAVLDASDIARTVVTRVDRRLNMAKFYAIEISGAMTGDYALIRSWGRLDTMGRIRIDLFATRGEAEVAKARLVAAKLRRGYRTGKTPPRPPVATTALRKPSPAPLFSRPQGADF